MRYPMPGDRIHKLAEVISVRDAPSLYHRLLSHWKVPGDVVIGADEPTTILAGTRELSSSSEFIEYMMELDLQTYLPDDILVKVDRAAMSASLETRVPLLDHRIVEFAASLPLQFKSNGRVGKRVLRELLYRHVPPDLVDRPKAGFAMPIAEWLRGPLRDWAEELISVDRLNSDGIFHQKPIRDAWEQHLSGGRSWAYHLWDILMFQAWLRSRDGSVAGPMVASCMKEAIA
jgi:asparagine synthase (glutamine-hydrolysing)